MEKDLQELVEDIKIVEERIKQFEQKDLIKDYKRLLLEKEYLVCQYTYELYSNNKNTNEEEIKNKR